MQLGLLADDGGVTEVAEAAPEPRTESSLGLEVEALGAEQRRQEQIVSGGVVVKRVTPGAGQDAGLRVGDIILTVAGNEIDSAKRLEAVIGNLRPGQSVPVLVQRRGAPLFLALEIPERRR